MAQNELAAISENVLSKIDTYKTSGEIKLPPDYSPENAIRSAYLVLLETKTKEGKGVLDVCTKESIANALLKMVVWGLSPLKKQCDFIPYGNQLQCTPEYTGNILLAKRYGGLIDYKPNAIFKGDDFKYEIGEDGRRKIIHHKQSLESLGGDVIGAYATYELSNGQKDVEIMNINQIRAAWNQGTMKGGSGAHKNFTDQMAIKSVLNRMCKLLVRTSDDTVLGLSGSDSLDGEAEQKDNNTQKQLSEKVNVEYIGFEEVENKTGKDESKVSETKNSNSKTLFEEEQQDESDKAPY